jgi:ADP-ribosylation factor related protein 1
MAKVRRALGKVETALPRLDSVNKMFTLLSGLYKYLTRKEEYFVLVLGLDNAGKTTMLEKIKSIFNGVPGMPPERILPTVGLNSN